MPAVAPRGQSTFDFDSLLGTYRGRAFLNVPEVCRILRRSDAFVEALIDSGKLHAHTTGAPAKDRKTVTTRSLALYLAETALYGGDDYEARLRDLAGTWTPEQRREFANFLLTTA